MTHATIPHLPANADQLSIDTTIDEVGCVILDDVLSSSRLDQLGTELEPWLRATGAGSKSGEPEWEEFHGRNTIRFNGVAAKSEAFIDLALDSALVGPLERRLLQCGPAQINDTQVISIGPGERAQYLHRDQSAWPWFNGLLPNGPEVTAVALVALTDCTAENGATRVVPGSHRLPDHDELFDPSASVPAEMSAGSALLFSGKTIHGGGANHTVDQWRTVVHFGLVLGWLRTEEAHPFSIPADIVAGMPRRAQELFGFTEYNPAPHPGGRLWLVDFEDPAAQFAPAL